MRRRATKTTRRSEKRREVETLEVKEPRTFVITHGVQNSGVQKLKRDLRRVFLPNTAQNVKERRFNKTRDFLDVCGPLGISHVLALFLTDTSLNLKIMKSPQGPTASFKITSYSLISNVQTALGHSFDQKHGFRSAPLVVMTNFQKSQHHTLLVTLLQNLFPAIRPQSTEIQSRKRVVLFHYDADDDRIHFRHYRLSIPVRGMNKRLRALLYEKGVPDLGDMHSINELISKGDASESEGEDNRVDLAPELTKDEPTMRRVKLTELGPRMDLVLHKIEQGVMDGLVLYNKYVTKSLEEIAETGRRREQTAQLKIQRRKEQERRVAAKREEKETRKRKALQQEIPREDLNEEDDDVRYYKEEVGSQPDAHFGVTARRKMREKGRRHRHQRPL